MRPLSFDRVAHRYDETRGGEERGRFLARELDRLLEPARPVLEIGIGTGLVALGLREQGHQVVGVDISWAMASRALARLGPVVAVGDARRLPLAGGSVDRAYSVWVLHVVGDRPAVLAEVRRILRPGGRYIVAPGDIGRPEDEVGEILWELERALDPRGDRADDLRELQRLAPGAGLRVIEERACPPRRFEMAPEEAARNIEQRLYSILWDVDQDRWLQHVDPVLRRLRAMPDPESSRPRVHVYPLIVLERPA